MRRQNMLKILSIVVKLNHVLARGIERRKIFWNYKEVKCYGSH